jgi:hypothetical protein
MHHHRPQADTFHKSDVLENPAVAIFAFHDAAAKLDDHSFTPELLNKG